MPTKSYTEVGNNSTVVCYTFWRTCTAFWGVTWQVQSSCWMPFITVGYISVTCLRFWRGCCCWWLTPSCWNIGSLLRILCSFKPHLPRSMSSRTHMERCVRVMKTRQRCELWNEGKINLKYCLKLLHTLFWWMKNCYVSLIYLKFLIAATLLCKCRTESFESRVILWQTSKQTTQCSVDAGSSSLVSVYQSSLVTASGDLRAAASRLTAASRRSVAALRPPRNAQHRQRSKATSNGYTVKSAGHCWNACISSRIYL